MLEILPQQLYISPLLKDYESAWRLGVDVVVNLTRRGSAPRLEPGRIVLHWPLRRPCREAEIIELVILLNGLLETGHRILIHCYAGRDRTGLVAAYLVARATGVGAEQALSFIRNVHPQVLSGRTLAEQLA